MRVLFFDIDGTLVDRSRGIYPIPQPVVEELERLHEAGDKLVVCSGRPYTMIDEPLRLPLFDAYVACNGAHVEVGGETVFLDRLDPEVGRAAAGLFEELGCDYMLETAHHVYLDPSFGELYDFFEPYVEPDFFTREFDRDEVLERTIKLEANVLERDYRRVVDAIEGRVGFVANADQHGTDHAFELYSASISKAVGVAKVLECFDADAQDAYGFGDGVNDLQMIEACGTGVAMGNAEDALKERADVLIGSIEDDGLASYLHTLCALLS